MQAIAIRMLLFIKSDASKTLNCQFWHIGAEKPFLKYSNDLKSVTEGVLFEDTKRDDMYSNCPSQTLATARKILKI